MSDKRLLAAGIAGFVLLAFVQWVILPILDYRTVSDQRLTRAARNHAAVSALSEEYAALRSVSKGAARERLFGIINREAEGLGLARRMEALRPAAGNAPGEAEHIELRMTGLHLQQTVRWLTVLEAQDGVRIDTLNIRRSPRGLLDMDISVSRREGER